MKRRALLLVVAVALSSGITAYPSIAKPSTATLNPCVGTGSGWGGMFKAIRNLYPKCQRHHLIADASVPKNDQTFPHKDGVAQCIPSVVMTPEDHRATPSWGTKGAAYRQAQLLLVQARKFREAILKEIAELKKIPAPSDPSKTLYDVYRVGLDQALAALDLVGDALDNLDANCNPKQSPAATTEPSVAAIAAPAPVKVSAVRPGEVTVTVQQSTFIFQTVELSGGFGQIPVPTGSGLITVQRTSTAPQASGIQARITQTIDYTHPYNASPDIRFEASPWFNVSGGASVATVQHYHLEYRYSAPTGDGSPGGDEVYVNRPAVVEIDPTPAPRDYVLAIDRGDGQAPQHVGVSGWQDAPFHVQLDYAPDLAQGWRTVTVTGAPGSPITTVSSTNVYYYYHYCAA